MHNTKLLLISAPNITYLGPNQVFVFGSNLQGYHGLGAAKTALDKFGAQMGVSEGMSGQCYLIPTKEYDYSRRRSVNDIEVSVNRFLDFAFATPNLDFLVTPIGCGYAGYRPKIIAPLFTRALEMENVYLPVEFVRVLI